MRGDGRPARMRTTYGVSGGTVGGDGSRSEWHDDFIDVINFTGTPAVRCDDTIVAGELVITYEHRASTDTWTTQAATTAVDWQGTPVEIGKPIFNILAGTIPVSSEIIRHTGDGRLTRAFTAPFSTPADAAPDQRLGDSTAAAIQSLWIDAESFLPVRWEVVIGGTVGYELVFNYQALDLRPPEGLSVPHCIL